MSSELVERVRVEWRARDALGRYELQRAIVDMLAGERAVLRQRAMPERGMLVRFPVREGAAFQWVTGVVNARRRPHVSVGVGSDDFTYRVKVEDVEVLSTDVLAWEVEPPAAGGRVMLLGGVQAPWRVVVRQSRLFDVRTPSGVAYTLRIPSRVEWATLHAMVFLRPWPAGVVEVRE